MTTKTNPASNQKAETAPSESRGERIHLSYQYGTIGIQAVAAAARYSDVRKKPAELRIDQRFVESAG